MRLDLRKSSYCHPSVIRPQSSDCRRGDVTVTAISTSEKPEPDDEKQDDLPPVKGIAHLDMLDRMSSLTAEQRRKNEKERGR